MTHSDFEIFVVRPDPAELWQQLWQVSHFVHQEKELARWELLSEPVKPFLLLPQNYCISSCQTAFFCTCRKLCANAFLGSAVPEGHGS